MENTSMTSQKAASIAKKLAASMLVASDINAITAKEFKFKKSGVTLPEGTKVTISFDGIKSPMWFMRVRTEDGYDFPSRVESAHRMYRGGGFTKPPSENIMEKWMEDGVAKSVTGKRTEPDGYGTDGSPSWLLVLGMI